MDGPGLSETALSRFTSGLVRSLVAGGCTRADVARRAGLGLTALEPPLTETAARQVWAAAPDLAGDPEIGLHFAERAAMEDLGIIGYLGRASATVGEACTRVVQLQRLFKDSAQLLHSCDDTGARIAELPRHGDPPLPRALAEALMASWLLWPRRWAGTELRPRQVCFQHSRPACCDEHARIFGCPVCFDRSTNEIEYSREAWSVPLQTADELLAQYLESAAVEQARRRSDGDGLMQRLERTIVDVMPSGRLGADRVARTVGLSPRSLHRRLNERGLTYQDLVDSLRHRTARSLLDRGEHSMTEIAFLVGFSDPSGLRRAIRRWTGRAPRAR